MSRLTLLPEAKLSGERARERGVIRGIATRCIDV